MATQHLSSMADTDARPAADDADWQRVPPSSASPELVSCDGTRTRDRFRPTPAQVTAEAARILGARLESVREARTFATATLDRWGLPDFHDDVGLVASEMVTNALQHALGVSLNGCAAPRVAAAGDGVRLRLLCREDHVMCAVDDPSNKVPVHTQPDFAAETGRGLHVVASLARRWGWSPLDSGGKSVWALFCGCRTDPAY